ncbi:hypothetical protein [Maribacter orientalis]|nr:hypothetical protein [Maribacter orientalis]
MENSKTQKERVNKILLIGQNIELTLKSILNLKPDLINSQQYEMASELHIVELKIKEAQIKLKKYVKKNTADNNVYKT